MIYYSRDDCKLIWKVVLSEQIKNVIKEKKDLFQFCNYNEIDGFLFENLNDKKVLLLFSNGAFLGLLELNDSDDFDLVKSEKFPLEFSLKV
jgi:hypothetical protein